METWKSGNVKVNNGKMEKWKSGKAQVEHGKVKKWKVKVAIENWKRGKVER